MAEEKATTGSEEFLKIEEQKWDVCLESLVTNVGKGLLIGSLSLFFRKPKLTAFSIGLGVGTGVGVAYSTCNYYFDDLKKWQKNL